MMTSTQASRAATPSTFWVLMYSSTRNGVVSFGVEMTLFTMSLTESNRPEEPITVQTTYTATTSMMPAAMENRNEVFITDHGSSRDSRRRALRVRRGVPTLGFGPGSGSASCACGKSGAFWPSTTGMTAVCGPVGGPSGACGPAGACGAHGLAAGSGEPGEPSRPTGPYG